jgi:hypothetical protein
MAHDVIRPLAVRGARWRGGITTALATLALLAAACGSSGSSAASSTTSSTTTTAAPASTTLPTAAASRAAITADYETLFDLSDPVVAPKLAVVEDGSSLRATFEKTLGPALAKIATGADVTGVIVYPSGPSCSSELLTPPCAKVTYDILGAKHKPLLSGSIGWAVYTGGHWLVAKATICGLLSLASTTTPAGC